MRFFSDQYEKTQRGLRECSCSRTSLLSSPRMCLCSKSNVLNLLLFGFQNKSQAGTCFPSRDDFTPSWSWVCSSLSAQLVVFLPSWHTEQVNFDVSRSGPSSCPLGVEAAGGKNKEEQLRHRNARRGEPRARSRKAHR